MEMLTITPEIYVVKNFLSEAECDDFIKLSEEIGYESAKVNIDGKQVEMTMVRNNQRVLYPNVALADQLWSRLTVFHGNRVGNSVAMGLNELFRFYKYSVKERFKRHRDGSYIRNEHEFSCYTFMVYLNSNFEGGQTKFENELIEPEKGMALMFKHELRHEGMPLISGNKYVLRSDVMYRFSGDEADNLNEMND